MVVGKLETSYKPNDPLDFGRALWYNQRLPDQRVRKRCEQHSKTHDAFAPGLYKGVSKSPNFNHPLKFKSQFSPWLIYYQGKKTIFCTVKEFMLTNVHGQFFLFFCAIF